MVVPRLSGLGSLCSDLYLNGWLMVWLLSSLSKAKFSISLDRIFQATKDVSFNEKVIASAEATIKACEEELVTLKEITPDSWFATPTDARRRYLLGKVAASERKIERLEVTNTDLKRVLARGG